MAIAPGTACRWPGCAEITKHPSGYCSKHQPEVAKQQRRQWGREHDQRRGSARQRGYDAAWEKFRRWYLNRYPLCHRCLKAGMTTPATVVHHIEPIKERPDLRLVAANCMPLCFDCHERVHGRK